MQNLHTSDAASPASFSFPEEAISEFASALHKAGRNLAAGAVAARSPAATDREPTSDEQAAPDLLELIRAYKAGMLAFNAGTADQIECDEFVKSTYGNHYETLKMWEGAATTREEAMEALRLADQETKNADNELALPLLRAARLYFEQERRFNVVDREQVWALGDAASEIGAMIMLMGHTLAVLDEQMAGNPDIKYVAALQNALRLLQRPNDYLEEQLHEIACRFNESANGVVRWV